MANNNRIWYACQKAGIAPLGSATYTVIHGLQSIGMTTNFQLQQVFEIGMSAIYENIEGIPSVEVTLQKVLDGYPPIYTLASQTQTGTAAADLVARSTGKVSLGLSYYSDTLTFAGTTQLQSAVVLSGLYFSAISYTLPIDGNATEDITLVGNNKVFQGSALTWTSDITSNSNDPLSIYGSGGINRREDLKTGIAGSIFPSQIPGITKWGTTTGSGYLTLGNATHLQNLKVSADVGRTEIFELGRKGVFYRFANFPVEVTTEIGMLSISGDMINAIEDTSAGTCGGAGTLVDERIVIRLCEGLYVDCGTKNKLKSVGVTGGDTGGGNVEITYTYSNFNDFTVYHFNDIQRAGATVAAFTPPGGF
jgi:hypothetical protein